MKINAYEQYLIQVSKEIILYLNKMGLTDEVAKDISQDVFVKLLELDLDIPPNKLRAWMYRVAINLAMDLFRRHRILQKVQQDYICLTIDDTNPTETIVLLSDALATLDFFEQHLLLIKYEQNFSIKEMAQIFNMTEAKIKIKLYRARQKLKQQ